MMVNVNKEILKKQIIYRSLYRGTKEMDLLLGNFVKKHIDELNVTELKDLAKLLIIEDEVIYKWYIKRNSDKLIPKTKVSTMLKNFKL
jgi:antitoxin CptB